MDDYEFDDLLKSKFENYEHPVEGTSALEQFIGRMNSYSITPWYVKFRTELFVTSAFVLFTAFNGYLSWINWTNNRNSPQSDTANSRNTVDSLIAVINSLQQTQTKRNGETEANTKTATEPLKVKPAVLVNQTQSKANTHTKLNELISKGYTSSNQKSNNGSLIPKEVATLDNESLTKNSIANNAIEIDMPEKIDVVYLVDTVGDKIARNKITVVSKPVVIKRNVSLKGVNESHEKKYSRGVGINLGGHADLATNFFTKGEGKLAPRIGITSDWVLSPHLSIETSLDYFSFKLASGKDLNYFHFHNQTPSLGEPKSVAINSQTVSLPINMKYRWWVSSKNQLVAKVGTTPYWMLRRSSLFSYSMPGSSSDDYSINTQAHPDYMGMYGTTWTVSLGLNRLLKNYNQFETSLFYEQSMGNVKTENVGVKIIGLRTAFLFHVR